MTVGLLEVVAEKLGNIFLALQLDAVVSGFVALSKEQCRVRIEVDDFVAFLERSHFVLGSAQIAAYKLYSLIEKTVGAHGHAVLVLYDVFFVSLYKVR